MKRRGVFLDLNGTLVVPLKQERLDELTLIPGVIQAIAKLTEAGFVCPVVSPLLSVRFLHPCGPPAAEPW